MSFGARLLKIVREEIHAWTIASLFVIYLEKLILYYLLRTIQFNVSFRQHIILSTSAFSTLISRPVGFPVKVETDPDGIWVVLPPSLLHVPQVGHVPVFARLPLVLLIFSICVSIRIDRAVKFREYPLDVPHFLGLLGLGLM